jgi:hypothetical protein
MDLTFPQAIRASPAQARKRLIGAYVNGFFLSNKSLCLLSGYKINTNATELDTTIEHYTLPGPLPFHCRIIAFFLNAKSRAGSLLPALDCCFSNLARAKFWELLGTRRRPPGDAPDFVG